MHQMKDFLRTILPSEGIYCASAIQGKKRFKGNYFVDTIDELTAKLQDIEKQGLNSFFAVASYPAGCTERKADKVAFLQIFFGDIDVDPLDPDKYDTQEDAIRAVVEFCRKYGWPIPTFVSSGYGVHIYWLLTKAIPKAQWQQVSDRIKQTMIAAGVLLDPSRTADAASILRPVGSLNRKDKNQPKRVDLIGSSNYSARVAPEDFAKLVGVTVVQNHFTGAEDIDFGDFPDYAGPPSDALEMAKNCAVVANFCNTRGQIGYENWFLMVGAVSFCQNGAAIAHEWSSGHPDYTEQETNEKLAEWEKMTGPPTCQKIALGNPNECAQCPHFGQYTTPVQGGVILEELPPVLTETGQGQAQVDTPAGFKRTKHGLYRMSGAPDVDDVLIYDGDVYVEDVVVGTSGKYEVTLVWESGKDGIKKHNFPKGIFSDARKMWQTTLDYGLNLVLKSSAEHFMTYVNSYASNLNKIKASIHGHNNMGWKPDGSFVLGSSTILTDGSIVENPAIAREITAAEFIGTKGSLDEWKRVVGMLDDQTMYKHSFAFMCGFGAPLMEPTGIDGALVNMLGRTGCGKSSVQKAISSIFGTPKAMMINSKDTENAKVARISQYSNLPACIDEMGNETPESLSSLVLSLTQGQDKKRLNTAGEERRVKDWCTLAITSSNHSFTTKINHMKGDADAEKMRLFEIEINDNRIFSDKQMSEDFNMTLVENHGHAGVIYLQHLVKNRASLQAIIKKCKARLPSLGINFENRERFWEAAVTTALAGGLIAKSLGLIQFDPVEVVRRLAHDIKAMQQKVSIEQFNAVDVLGQFMGENLRNIVKIKDEGGMIDYEPRQGLIKLVGRIEEVYMPNGLLATARGYFSKADLVEYLRQRYIDFSFFERRLADVGVKISMTRKQLGTKKDIGAWAAVPVVVVDLKTPQFEYVRDAIKDGYDDLQHEGRSADNPFSDHESGIH